MWKRLALAIFAAAALAGPATAQERATIRLAPREGAATPMLYTIDGSGRREGVDQSMFGVRADTPMPIPAGRRLNMVLSFEQSHPGRIWTCDAFFSFEPRPGAAYRVTHAHRFEQDCSAEVIDLAANRTDATFRVETPLPAQ